MLLLVIIWYANIKARFSFDIKHKVNITYIDAHKFTVILLFYQSTYWIKIYSLTIT